MRKKKNQQFDWRVARAEELGFTVNSAHDSHVESSVAGDDPLRTPQPPRINNIGPMPGHFETPTPSEVNNDRALANDALYIHQSEHPDKAAYIEPFPRLDQVGEVKKMLSMIPLWTTFLVYGLLQATANVFFYEQVEYMDTHLGHHVSNIPVVMFAVIIKSTSFVVSYICEKLFQNYWGERMKIPRHIMLIRIGIGLAITPVCCIISWRVESYRLEQRVKYGVSANAVWLIPQFVLLGILDGLVFDGIEDFFCANFSQDCFRKYGPSLTQFAPNIGHFISLALVSNLRSLFGDDLDKSSLGLYYAILGYVCFVNFMFYCYVATHFVKRADQRELFVEDEEMSDQVQEELQNMEDITAGRIELKC